VMSSSLRVTLLLVVLMAVLASTLVYNGEELIDDMMPMDKRNFQYIWRNLPIGPSSVRQINDKRSDSLSRDRASAFYRLG
ncbi:hypothetical protein PFISCL1PPCAC_5181, partial [Pristionchus fissidentatus]